MVPVPASFPFTHNTFLFSKILISQKSHLGSKLFLTLIFHPLIDFGRRLGFQFSSDLSLFPGLSPNKKPKDGCYKSKKTKLNVVDSSSVPNPLILIFLLVTLVFSLRLVLSSLSKKCSFYVEKKYIIGRNDLWHIKNHESFPTPTLLTSLFLFSSYDYSNSAELFGHKPCSFMDQGLTQMICFIWWRDTIS